MVISIYAIIKENKKDKDNHVVASMCSSILNEYCFNLIQLDRLLITKLMNSNTRGSEFVK